MTGTPWPNWVDLIVIIIVFLSSYNGFVRGIITEVLYGVGAMAVTVAAINWWPVASGWLQGRLPVNPAILAPFVFWGVFIFALTLVKLALRRVAEVVKWERVHWLIQGIGMVLGGARGLWWAGLFTLALTTSGFDFLHTSVVDRSVLGPRLMYLFREAVIIVSDHAPGAEHRTRDLIPPFNDLPRKS